MGSATGFRIGPIWVSPYAGCPDGSRLAPVSNVNFFSKTDYLSKIAIFKLHLEVEVIGLDITKFDYQRG